MGEEELKELADDITVNGLQNPIVLNHDGTVLIDGRNRWLACEIAGVSPDVRQLNTDYGPKELVDFIVSANVRRRHLTAGQRAMIGVDLEPIYAEAAKERQGTRTDLSGQNIPADLPESNLPESREQAASAVGASGRGVSQAKAVLRDAPDLAEKVRKGEMALDAADRVRRLRNQSVPDPKSDTKSRRTPIRYDVETIRSDIDDLNKRIRRIHLRINKLVADDRYANHREEFDREIATAMAAFVLGLAPERRDHLLEIILEHSEKNPEYRSQLRGQAKQQAGQQAQNMVAHE
jgi:ParB-like chromosome segregation protein Spo0J